MADTPDVSQYVDLRMFDRDAQSIFDVMLQDLQSKIPGWTPDETATEVALMESMAIGISESIFAINRIPGAIMVVLMQMFGITRDDGAYPVASVKVTAVDSFGHTVPVGSRFALSTEEGIDTLVLTSTQAVVIPAGAADISVPVIGNQFTREYNAVPAGTNVELLDSISWIERASLSTAVTGGRDPEDDAEWAARGSARLRRLSSVLLNSQQFTEATLEDTAVSMAVTIDAYNPDSPTPENAAGHVTVAVYGQGGVVPPADKTRIEEYLTANASANLIVHVVDPSINSVNITVDIVKQSNYTEAMVDQAITSALVSFFDPNNSGWSSVVRRNELIAVIGSVDGVAYIDQIATPTTDVTLTGVAPLAQLGTVTINYV